MSVAVAVAVACTSSPSLAGARPPIQRTFFSPSSSNGHGAVMLDLTRAHLTHFREHLFATEEPVLDSQGNASWNGSDFSAVASRDLLLDAHFGLRVGGSQAWLTDAPVDLDASGFAPWRSGKVAGTGVVTMVQTTGSLTATQFFFAPRNLPHAGFVMALRVHNNAAITAPGVSVFTMHNFHLGFGRPGVMMDIGANGETITFSGAGGRADFLERGFAGVVVARALGLPSHHGASSPGLGPQIFDVVNGGSAVDLPDLSGERPTADDSISGYQFNLGDVPAGGDGWAGVAFAHEGDPFGGPTVQGWLDAYVGNRGAETIVKDEIAEWTAFQGALTVPASLTQDEETLLRQSAVTLAMAQVQEDSAFLRPVLTTDGDVRTTRFGTTIGGPRATLPALIVHRGKGAVLAGLPPGEWTVAWMRDGAYAVTAMAALGMKDRARSALEFFLNADSGRFQHWRELASYNMPPYLPSLVRYHGFGIEQTDFNSFGPNLEFDGFGLFLWAVNHYEALTGDTTLVDKNWPVLSTKVADVLVALIDPATGLLRPDSSIWETHWNGRQRTWAYTNITAVRGLCDAAILAHRVGDTTRAHEYQDAARALRAAIAGKLTDAAGALASNTEELAAGEGYWDAAVLDAIAFGLFDPMGPIATATLAGLDAHLSVAAGPGWSRNDDRTDHAGAVDLSPWGSEYDSAEWVITDLRGAVVTRLMGQTARSETLLAWIRDQSLANSLAVAETFDENTGKYKFNAPMVGFGAGVYTLALAAREHTLDGPACGDYFPEASVPPGPRASSASSGSSRSSSASSSSSSNARSFSASSPVSALIAPPDSRAPNLGGNGGDIGNDTTVGSAHNESSGRSVNATAPASGACGLAPSPADAPWAPLSLLAWMGCSARRRRGSLAGSPGGVLHRRSPRRFLP